MVVLRGGMQRTTRAHAMAFEGSRVRGSGFDSRASPRRDHRPSGSGDEQVLVTRSIHVKEGAAGRVGGGGCGERAWGGSTIVRAEVSALRWQTGSNSSGFFEIPASKRGQHRRSFRRGVGLSTLKIQGGRIFQPLRSRLMRGLPMSNAMRPLGDLACTWLNRAHYHLLVSAPSHSA